jgi:hypothetical protein
LQFDAYGATTVSTTSSPSPARAILEPDTEGALRKNTLAAFESYDSPDATATSFVVTAEKSELPFADH